MKNKVFARRFFDFFKDVRSGMLGFRVQTELQQQKTAYRRPANRLDEKLAFDEKLRFA